MTPVVVSVLVVDDHEPFRRVAVDLVTSTTGVLVAGQASSGEHAIDQVASCSPDVVLMDVRMPGIGGLEAARAIRANHPETLVVLLSTEPQAETSDTPVIVNKRALTEDFLLSLASIVRERWRSSERPGHRAGLAPAPAAT